MRSEVKFRNRIRASRFRIYLLSRKVKPRIKLGTILNFDKDIMRDSRKYVSSMYHGGKLLPYSEYSQNASYQKLIRLHKRYIKHHMECLNAYDSKDLTDEDLALILINLYYESGSIQNFRSQYRNAQMLYEVARPEVFERFKLILQNSALFR